MIEPRDAWNYLKKYLSNSSSMYVIGFGFLVACFIISGITTIHAVFYTFLIVGISFLFAGYAHDVISGKHYSPPEKHINALSSVPLQARNRKEILVDCMIDYVRQGYEVTNATEFTVFMKRDRRFSCLWASILTISGIGLLLYILYYWSKRDNFIAIYVDEYGNVTVTKSNEGMIA